MSKDEANRPAGAVGESIDRRNFLKIVGVAGAASAVPAAGAVAAEMTHMHLAQAGAPAAMANMPAAAAAPKAEAWHFFNSDEAAFIEAAVDTLIPADAVGPGGVEAGVAVYIDRQLAGAYGKGDRLYLEGPFGENPTPEQGYQLPLTPAELIRIGIADVDAHATATKKNNFSGLSPADRAAIMSELDGNKVKLATVPTATFFGLLLGMVMEGYFADPMYGGNRNKAAWKMIGFPGAGGMYADKIEPFRNKPYKVEPQSIADLS